MKKITFEVSDEIWTMASPMIGVEKKYRNQTIFLIEAIKRELKRNGLKIE